LSSRSKFERVLYLDASPLTVETRLSLTRRLAPTGTRTALSAITCACADRVLGWVEDVARAFVRRVPAAVRLVVRALLRALVPALAGLRRVVVLRLGVVGFGSPGLLVDMVFS
jgi:hypothetical protein